MKCDMIVYLMTRVAYVIHCKTGHVLQGPLEWLSVHYSLSGMENLFHVGGPNITSQVWPRGPICMLYWGQGHFFEGGLFL